MDQGYKKKIRNFYDKRGRMPSYSEIMTLTGFSSKNAVFRLVERLERDNFLAKDRSGRLIPKFNTGIPILGTVEAGWPSPAEEELSNTIDSSLCWVRAYLLLG